MGLFDFFKTNVSKLEDKKDVSGQIIALQHEDRAIRRAAAQALGEIGDPQSVDLIVPLLKNKREEVRVAAVWALGEIADQSALGSLISTLRNSNRDSEVGLAAVWALGEIGDARALESLIEAAGQQDSRICKAAEIAIGKLKIDGDKAFELLRSAITDPKNDVEDATAKEAARIKEAAQIMDKCGHKVAAEALRNLGVEGARTTEIIEGGLACPEYKKKYADTDKAQKILMSAKQTFRVFVSSTFTDMQVERRALQEKVFPRLETLCQEHGCSFQAVDLRWGVGEEAQYDHKTMDICLNEIARCQRLSPKPNFIILMGDKYGWRPLPNKIPGAEMSRILKAGTPEEQSLLKQWYEEDQNAKPAEFLLQPRNEEHRDDKVWRLIEQELKNILRVAVDRLEFTEQQRKKYFASATHLEILRGALSPPPGVPATEEHVFAYFRKIENLPEDGSARDYIDMDGKNGRDSFCKEQLEAIRRELEEKLPQDHRYPYAVFWQEGGLNFAENTLDVFGAQVYRDLSQVILQQLAELGEDDPLEGEIRRHEEFRRERVKHFTGRETAMESIKKYLAGTNQQVLAVIGPSGSGKTSLLAHAVQLLPAGSVSVSRFLGTTAGSSKTNSLLELLVRQIASEYGEAGAAIIHSGEAEQKFGTLGKLQELFSSCLQLASESRPLTLVLDALDQLSGVEGQTGWLPSSLPPHVRMVISALPSLSGELEAKQAILQPLPPMFPKEGEELLDRWLTAVNRTLQPAQRQAIISVFMISGSPLYLKLVFEIACHWHSYSPLVSLPSTIDAILAGYFDELEREHGVSFVQRFCGYILSGKYHGLAERELLDLFVFDQGCWNDFIASSHPDHREEIFTVNKLPIVVWSRLYLDLEPYLGEKEATGTTLLSFFHRQFHEYAAGRYLSGKERYHRVLADYFETRWPEPSLRALDELPYQRLQAKDWDGLSKVLCDFKFIETKCRANMTYELVKDYCMADESLQAGNRAEVTEFGIFVTRNSHVFSRYSELVFQEAMNELDDSYVLQVATKGEAQRESRSWFKCLNNQQRKSSWQMTLDGHAGRVILACTYSPDGRKIVSASHDQTLKVWDAASGQEEITLSGHEGSVDACAYSPNGSKIVSASSDMTLKVWDAASGREEMTLRGHSDKVFACTYSPDGRKIVSTSADGSLSRSKSGNLKVWDAVSGQEEVTLTNHTNFVFDCAYSPDGSRIVSASNDSTLKVWDAAIGQEEMTLSGHLGGVLSCDYSPDGSKITSASLDGTLKVWDAISGREEMTLAGHQGIVFDCAYSPDGRKIVSAQDKTLKVWDAASGREEMTLVGHSGRVRACAYSPDGRKIVSASEDGTLKVWDATRGGKVMTPAGHAGRVKVCAYSSDGSKIVSASEDGTLKVWDAASGRDEMTLVRHSPTQWEVMDCAWSPDGSKIVAAYWDGTLIVWRAATGREEMTLAGKYLIHCAYSPDGQKIVSKDQDGTLKIRDAASGRKVVTIRDCALWKRFIYSPDGSKIVSACRDGALKVWNAANGQEKMTIIKRVDFGIVSTWEDWKTMPKNAVTDYAWSPDGSKIVSASEDKTLKVWDAASGRKEMTLAGHLDEVSSCAYSPDGSKIVSASKDGTLRVWDTITGLEEMTIDGHEGGMFGCAYSPVGKTLVSALSYNNTVQVWDVVTGRKICTCVAEDTLECLAWSPRKEQLVVGGLHGIICILDVHRSP